MQYEGFGQAVETGKHGVVHAEGWPTTRTRVKYPLPAGRRVKKKKPLISSGHGLADWRWRARAATFAAADAGRPGTRKVLRQRHDEHIVVGAGLAARVVQAPRCDGSRPARAAATPSERETGATGRAS